MSVSRRWRDMIEAEHAQSQRVRGSAAPTDHWRPLASRFVADPHRTDDPLVARLKELVRPEDTVIDVGSGPGRLALPLALYCSHVTAVEPSPSMASLLTEQARDHGIRNVTLVEATWEDAAVEAGDVVLCAHVIYTARDPATFVKKLGAHARRYVAVVLFRAPPQSQLYSLWPPVHGEERLPLPALPELEELLQELGIGAWSEALPPQPNMGFESEEQAMEQLAERLYVEPNTPKWSLLQRALRDQLEEIDGELRMAGTRALESVLVLWEPGR